MRKEELNEILDSRDWVSLTQSDRLDRALMRNLMNRIYVKDGLQFWRAIEALGVAAREINKNEGGYAVECVRRYFWALNDESGGTAWNASEAIGSLVAHNPKDCGHFNWMLSGLLEDESLQEGALWGIAQISMVDPELVLPLAERVLPFLQTQDTKLRGLAAWIYALMKNHAKDDQAWYIPDHIEKALLDDQSELEIYVEGGLKTFSISDLVKFTGISFWSEELQGKGYT